jgi:hypothetical protein
MDTFSLIFVSAVIAFLVYAYTKAKRKKQLTYIESYRFHESIKSKLQQKYPTLTNEQLDLVFRGLRDYFYICNRSGKKMISMPSRIVDDAWHEFILFTRTYKTFCLKALGRFLHHTPAEAMKTPTLAQEGIKRAWRIACSKEGISPKNPVRLPLIFALDSMLNIPNGFRYSINCRDNHSPLYGDEYCAGHIGCASGCSGDSGSDSDSGGFFDGFGDSSGCSSDCGGGCGGD